MQTLQNSTKSTSQFLSNSCLKNGTQKQKFPIWKSRLSSSYTLTSVTVCALDTFSAAAVRKQTLDFVCFGQFLGPFLLKALKFQVLVNDSVYRLRRDTGFPSDLTYASMSSRGIFLADNQQFSVANVVSCAAVRFLPLPDFLSADPVASISNRSRSSAERDQSLSGNSSNNFLAL